MDFTLVNLIIYILVVLMSSFGILGNVISMIIWTRPHMKSTSAIFLTALAACDLIIDLRMLSRSIPGTIMTYSSFTNDYNSTLYAFSKYYILPYSNMWVFPIFRMAITASTYLSLIITLERFIAVCYTFQFREICTQRRAILSVIAIICFSIVFNASRFWENKVVPVKEGYKYVGLDLMRNPVYIAVYRTYLHLIFTYILPLASIIILNTAIYIELRNADKNESLTNLQKNENRLAMMLLYVVLEFLVCSSVTGFLAIWRIFGPYDAPVFGVKLTGILNPLSLFFDTFNSSVNFLSYVIFWGPFRRTLKSWLKWEKHQVPPESPDGQCKSCDTVETVI